MTTMNSQRLPVEPRPKSGWKWPALFMAMAAVALFGARPALANISVSSISVAAQGNVVCEGSATTATYVVTVNAAGSGSAIDSTLFLSVGPPSGTSFSCVTSCTDHITVAGASTVTINLTTASAVAQNATSFTVKEDHNNKTSSRTYTVNTAIAKAGPDQIFCATTTATLAGNAVIGGSGAWTVITGPATVTTPSSPTSGVTGLGPGLNTFRWTITPGGGCVGSPAADDVNITRSLPPTTATAGGPQTICAGAQTSGLGGNTPSSGAGTWSVFSGGTGSFTDIHDPNAKFTHVSGAGPVILHWTISNPPCTDSVASVSITINPLPAATGNLGGPNPICLSTAFNLNQTGSGADKSCTWTAVPDAGSGVSGGLVVVGCAPSPITPAAGTFSYYLTVTRISTGCVSATTLIDSKTVEAGLPSPTITPSPTTVCPSSAGNQASGPAGAATWAWTASNGSITSATNIQTITYTAGASGSVTLNLTITGSSACGSGTASNSALVPITPALSVSSTSPLDGATGVSTGTSISVTFNTAADPASITTNTADTSCSGSLQVSADSFSTCVQMSGAPVASAGNTVFTITPSSPLAVSTTYKIRVTTGAENACDVALASAFTQASGFTTTAAGCTSTPTAVASITGSNPICPGGSTTLLGAGGTSCSWSPPTGLDDASSCTPTASPTLTTTYSLTVTDESNCVSTNSAQVTVNVIGTIAVTGNTEVCVDGKGGDLSVVPPTTGTTHFQWGYRTVSGTGVITDLSGHTNAIYTVQGSDFPGAGTYFLVCTSYMHSTECGTQVFISNEIAIDVVTEGIVCPGGVPNPAQFFTLTTRTGSGTNILQWVNPASGVDNMQVQSSISSALCPNCVPYPATEVDGSTETSSASGSGGIKITFPISGLTPDTDNHYYSLFSRVGAVFSGGRNVSGYPFSAPPPVKWAFSSAGITLAPPALLLATNSASGAVYAATNAREIHSMNVGTAGGDWPTFPATWIPFRMNGPSQDRPVPNTFTTFTIGGTKNVLFTSSLDGSAYANDSRTGAPLWHGTFPLVSDYVLGAPALIFQEFNPSVLIPNTVFVAANCFVTGSGCTNPGRSSLVAVDPATGGFIGDYDGTPDSLQIGVIPGQPIVELSSNLGLNPHRVFFASHSLAGGPTVWALNAASGVKLWGNSSVGDASTQVSRNGTTLYVGDVSGKVWSLDHAAGTTKWSYDTTLGSPVKSVVAANGGRVFFSVGNNVYALTDSGLSSSVYWTIATLASPGPPTVVSGGPYGAQGKAYVGTGDGKVCEIDVLSQVVKCVQVGPTNLFQVGRTTFDSKNNLLYVGTEPGQVYSISVPLP